jgi:putative oxidoreductase
MTLLRAVARPMLASMFVSGGIAALRNAPAMAPAAQPVADKVVPLARRVVPGAPIPDDPTTLVRINGAIHLGAGVMLATGRFPRLASFALAATLVPTTAMGHQFWSEQDPSAKAEQRVHFFKNVSMMGGLLMATLDPAPHKKMLVVRAKDAAVGAGAAVAEAATHANERAEKAAKKAQKRAAKSRKRATKKLR